MRRLLLLASLLAASPTAAQQTPAPPPVATPHTTIPHVAPPPAVAQRVLFIGNSFTQGAHSAVRNWHSASVTDLNGAGYGGVPALFKLFADQAGLAYDVSLETQGGKTLGFHYEERRALIDRPWDVVVLQELSTLSRAKPGDDTDYLRDVERLTLLLRARNPAVRIYLMPTWSRADQTYQPDGHWYGKPIARMADDLRTAANRAAEASKVAGIIPVGDAWNRAFATGYADPNPYDGIAANQVNLWTYDNYHAGIHGYYLEALVAFGKITGRDPAALGKDERAADELGISELQAASMQRLASEQLLSETERVPEP